MSYKVQTTKVAYIPYPSKFSRLNFCCYWENSYLCIIKDKKKNKKHELIRFYVTDDKNHLPVRLDMNLSFGTAKAYLRSYQGVRNEMTSIIK